MNVDDRLGRGLRDLRVSVTDRCNFRCGYCMPRDVFGSDFSFLDRDELLTFEEITRVVTVFTQLGVRKIRLTGGEPLLRRDLDRLVAMIAALPGVEDLALTTNGSLLPRSAGRLRAAGLRRVTVSLDSVEEAVFSSMADVDVPLSRVLEGIAAAVAVGFDDVKLNAVVKRGTNDAGIEALAAYGRDVGATVRFIEYMDVGTTNAWRLDEVVPAAEVLARLDAAFGIEPLEPRYRGEVATRYRYRDGRGEVGVIASVTQPFCGTCTRARLSAVGELYTCLFATSGSDLRRMLRSGGTDAELRAAIAGRWAARDDRYSQLRTAGAAAAGGDRVEMSYIGG